MQDNPLDFEIFCTKINDFFEITYKKIPQFQE